MKKRFLVLLCLLLPYFNAYTQISMLKDIVDGEVSSSPDSFHVMNNEIYFYTGQNEIWRSNGTAAGTVAIKDLPHPVQSFNKQIISANGKVYFIYADIQHGPEIWCYDRNKNTSFLLKDILPGNLKNYPPMGLTSINDTVYFIAYSNIHKYQVWRTDGTSNGTIMISHFNSSGLIKMPKALHNIQGKLVAIEYDNISPSIMLFNMFKFDPGINDFVFIKQFRNNYYDIPDYFTTVGNQTFFTANDSATGRELWVTDLTTTGTYLVKDFIQGYIGSNTQLLCAYNGRVYFNTSDNLIGHYQLWRSDGTDTGTKIIPVVQGATSLFPRKLKVFQNRLYINYNFDLEEQIAYIDENEKAHKVHFKQGIELHPIFHGFITTEQKLLFFGFTKDFRQALFEIRDDSAYLITTISNDPTKNMLPTSSIVMSGELYFNCMDNTHGRELWRSRFQAPYKYNFSFNHFIYPNPVQDVLHILPRFFDYYRTPVKADIYNNTGKIVMKDITIDYSNPNIDVSELSSGIYTIVLRVSDDKVMAEQWIKF